jgi:hypothetical protein
MMSESTVPIEFIGGSLDGETLEVPEAPEHYEVTLGDRVMEIYERQNKQPPFVYVQIGYAGKETWK